ncbi:MAG: hypothetical protein ACREOD_09990 [Candidatus Dormibacteria bacterium]
MDRVSISIPPELARKLRENPSAYGVADQRSEAARLQKLLLVGAELSRRRVEEEAMAAAYDKWSGDDERRATVAGVADLLLGQTGLADSILRRPKPGE